MKKTLLLVASYIVASYSFSQIVDTVSMSAGYANETYYGLSDESETSVVRDNWDLAFASDGLGFAASTIRINGSMGTELYLYGSDTTQWDMIDTTGFAWNQLVNSDADWWTGAFENQSIVDPFDLGWGSYNIITHAVEGDRIFILKLANGDYKKIIIESLTGGIYSFKYADLDGSNEISATLDKVNFTAKNFGYYSIQNNQTVNREPDFTSWDFVFTGYVTELAPGVNYPVTGVLANTGVKVAEVYNVPDVNTVSHEGLYYDTSYINVIGWDWKTFNLGTFQYEIEDSLVYFAEIPDGSIYKLIFTGFGGSTDGNFIFTKELIKDKEETSINNNIVNPILDIYPNPASDVINLTFINSGNDTQVFIYNASGQQVAATIVESATGLSQERIDVSNLTSGMYFLTLTSSNSTTTQKIIIK